jgi:sulfur carrier protein ThiS
MATVFKLTRVFRHFVDGVPQISDFQDTPPTGDNDLEVRMKHFTEIENFTFLGYVLAHELEGGLEPISTIQDLVVPDAEFQRHIDGAKTVRVTTERLGDELLDVGINWEHFVASNNDKMIPGDPLKVSDVALQAKIDSLDLLSEALVAEVNLRAMKKHKKG